MKYELPELPTEGRFTVVVPADYGESFDAWTEKGVRQYAEQAVAPLLAEIERLKTALEEAIASLDCGMVLGAKDILSEAIFKHDRA